MEQRGNWFVRIVVGLVEFIDSMMPIKINTRLKACLVDFWIISFFIPAVGILFELIYSTTTKSSDVLVFADKSFIASDIFPCLIFLPILLKDSLSDGNSISKNHYGFKVVDFASGEDISAIRKVIRNLTIFIWPIEVLLILSGNRRIGDVLAGSIVITQDAPRYGGSEDILDD